MAENPGVVKAAQAVMDAVEEFYDFGCKDSYMASQRSGDTYRAVRNAWMVARSCRSVAQGSGGGFAGNPQTVQEYLRSICRFLEMASRAELDTATVRQELHNIGDRIDRVEHEISGSLLDRHVLGEWIAAVREVDAAKEQVIRHQEVFDKQIERWENVGRTSFGGAAPYTKEAKSAKWRTVGWAVLAGVLAVVTVSHGFSIELDVGEGGRTVGDALYGSAGRWAAFAVLIGAVTWCGRRASANAHLTQIARDRASAWESYHVLVASGGQSSEAARALAAKLFDTPTTGFLTKAAQSIPSAPWRGEG